MIKSINLAHIVNFVTVVNIFGILNFMYVKYEQIVYIHFFLIPIKVKICGSEKSVKTSHLK